MYTEINERYNQTYILLKNAVNNYKLNVDYLRPEGNPPSYLQRVSNHLLNQSATRLKYYPYQDIISFVFYHSIWLHNLAEVSY